MAASVLLVNATYAEIEAKLLAGDAPAKVAADLQEPMAGVLAVWGELRNAGRVNPANHPAGKTPAQPSGGGSGGPSLFDRAARIVDNKQVARLLDRALDAHQALQEAVTLHASKAEARATVARLEAELAAARAALKGPASEMGVVCSHCGKKCATERGLGVHVTRAHLGRTS